MSTSAEMKTVADTRTLHRLGDNRTVNVSELVEAITPLDAQEAEHLAVTRSWLAKTDDIYRREKPATPDPHLVSYFVPVDEGKILLVEHRLAGLWLPPGGHVEPGEHPAETVRREAREELGVEAEFLENDPVFLTRTRTRGPGQHVDVSLWFLLAANHSLTWDRREFASIRWWSPAEIEAADADQFDPHLTRFLRKVGTVGPRRGAVVEGRGRPALIRAVGPRRSSALTRMEARFDGQGR